MQEKLADELIAASRKEGASFKKREGSICEAFGNVGGDGIIAEE